MRTLRIINAARPGPDSSPASRGLGHRPQAASASNPRRAVPRHPQKT